MQLLEVSSAVRLIHKSLSVKGLKISENLLKFQYGNNNNNNNNNNYIIVSAHNIASDPVLNIIITRDCFYQTIISLHMPAMNLINISKTALLNKLCWYLEVNCQQRNRLQYRLKHRYS